MAVPAKGYPVALVPGLPSISLHGGDTRQAEIRDAIYARVTTYGIPLRQLFDGLTAFKAEDTTWVVSDMLARGLACYDSKTDLLHINGA